MPLQILGKHFLTNVLVLIQLRKPMKFLKSPWLRRGLRPSILFPVLLLAGCFGAVLQSSYNDYSDVYAQTQNRQMLLNLARMHEGFPIYFFQLGNISASYTFSENATLAGNRTSTQTGAAAAANGFSSGFNFGESMTHNPTFQYVPLAGANFATQMLQPIKPTVFYELYQEGLPVDELMRVLIQRVEVDNTDGTKMYLENDAWDGAETNNPVDGPTPNSIPALQIAHKNYALFLDCCRLARICQQQGLLHLSYVNEVQPLANVTFSFDPNYSASATNASTLFLPGFSDITSANKDGLTWQQSEKDGFWIIGKNAVRPVFKLDDTDDVHANAGDANESSMTTNINTLRGISQSLTSSALRDELLQSATPITKPGINLFFDSVSAGIEVVDQTGGNQPGKAAPSTAAKGGKDNEQPKASLIGLPTPKPQVRFVMRSLLKVIQATATEEQAFAYHKAHKNDKNEIYNGIVPAERFPLLQLTWPDLTSNSTADSSPPSMDDILAAGDWPVTKPPAKPIVVLDFNGKRFQIADPQPDRLERPSTWNRDVFRLLVQLSFQVTTDTTSADLATPPLVQLKTAN